MVVCGRGDILNSVLITKLIELLARKLWSTVMDDPSGDTKSMDDMVFDEVNNIGDFNLSERYPSAHFEK